jgi:hypothetical protein
MRYNNRTDVTEKKKKLRCILGHPSLQCFILSLSRTSSFPRTSLGMDAALHKLAFFKIHIRPKPPWEASQSFILPLSRAMYFPRMSLGMDVTLHKLASFKIYITPGPPREAR